MAYKMLDHDDNLVHFIMHQKIAIVFLSIGSSYLIKCKGNDDQIKLR